jgi:hypothetical protein
MDNKDNGKAEDERSEGLILVGFGKHNLSDMLGWIDTSKEEDLAKAFKKWPPVWRREGACSVEEVHSSLRYLAYLQDVIVEYELNGPYEGDKESN